MGALQKTGMSSDERFGWIQVHDDCNRIVADQLRKHEQRCAMVQATKARAQTQRWRVRKNAAILSGSLPLCCSGVVLQAKLSADACRYSCVVCRYYRPNARLLERLYEHFRKTGKLKQLQTEYVPPEADS